MFLGDMVLAWGERIGDWEYMLLKKVNIYYFIVVV